MASKNPPKKLYVTSKMEYDATVPLGFLGEYKPGVPTHENKMRAQEKWAYIENSGFHTNSVKLVQRHGEWFVSGEKWGPWTPGSLQSNKIWEEKKIETPPVIWDNTPQSGFKVDKFVSRWSTANKLWRIIDPRGIQFEVTTECLHELIMAVGIEKGGEIPGECLWFSNKKLIVAS